MNDNVARGAHLTLEPGCTLQDSTDLQFLLLTTRCTQDTLIVDGRRVERIDSAGLQLLVAFAQLQAKAGRKLQWSGASELLLRSSRRLGLDSVLGFPAIPDLQAQPG